MSSSLRIERAGASQVQFERRSVTPPPFPLQMYLLYGQMAPYKVTQVRCSDLRKVRLSLANRTGLKRQCHEIFYSFVFHASNPSGSIIEMLKKNIFAYADFADLFMTLRIRAVFYYALWKLLKGYSVNKSTVHGRTLLYQNYKNQVLKSRFSKQIFLLRGEKSSIFRYDISAKSEPCSKYILTHQ